MKKDLKEVIKTSKVIIQPGRYAYIKTDKAEINNHFFVSQDDDEVTVVTEEKNLESVKYNKDVKWFKLIEICVSMPFVAKGFLAKVTKTIADKGLNVLVVSTFSKDYILVKEEIYSIAIDALEKVGFPIVQK